MTSRQCSCQIFLRPYQSSLLISLINWQYALPEVLPIRERERLIVAPARYSEQPLHVNIAYSCVANLVRSRYGFSSWCALRTLLVRSRYGTFTVRCFIERYCK